MGPNDQEPSGNQIMNLVNSDESQSLAFESELRHRAQAAELIAEMANSGGGTILIGVEEPRKLVGLDDPAEATQVAKEAAKTISPAVEVTVNEVEVEGLTVAAVEVPPAGREPVLPPEGPIVKRDAAGNRVARSTRRDELGGHRKEENAEQGERRLLTS
jgi:predicted HTH transcriptional regulator